MNAILWDGSKQLKGELEIKEHHIQFVFHDFSKTNISLEIPFDTIENIQYIKIYGIKPKAISIHSKQGNTNVFVVEDTKALKEKIETTLLYNQSKNAP